MAKSMDKPELETLNYRPAKRVNKADNASQPKIKETEQPNPELMIVKTIQGLTSVINNELSKLSELTKFLSCNRNSLVLQALEDIDLFEKTTMFELQKAFE